MSYIVEFSNENTTTCQLDPVTPRNWYHGKQFKNLGWWLKNGPISLYNYRCNGPRLGAIAWSKLSRTWTVKQRSWHTNLDLICCWTIRRQNSETDTGSQREYLSSCVQKAINNPKLLPTCYLRSKDRYYWYVLATSMYVGCVKISKNLMQGTQLRE